MSRRSWIGSSVLLISLAAIGFALSAYKASAQKAASAAAANQPEPAEAVAVVVVQPREHRRTSTSIGTVLALRSITLRNELAGTVKSINLTPGEIVEPGTLLVQQDTSVEQAELQAHEAQAKVAEAVLRRMVQMLETRTASATELDRSRAERDVALANIARAKAVIDRKTIRAPFRAHVGISDVHPGQYLEEATLLTTLQGVDNAAHVDFTVAQRIAAGLKPGDEVIVIAPGSESAPVKATVVAVDAKVDPTTRNAMVRARVEDAKLAPAPGASVRVRVPAGPVRKAVAVPVSALRKGPQGDHVFVVAPDAGGKDRAMSRKVEAGELVGDEVLILSGLKEGERVAAAGSFKLRDAVLVIAAPTAVPATAPTADAR
jgi:RND family efflux transporter MFP subunit